MRSKQRLEVCLRDTQIEFSARDYPMRQLPRYSKLISVRSFNHRLTPASCLLSLPLITLAPRLTLGHAYRVLRRAGFLCPQSDLREHINTSTLLNPAFGLQQHG